jgi:hypothetical protein
MRESPPCREGGHGRPAAGRGRSVGLA